MQKFKLKKDFTFWWPVKVSIPDPEKPGSFAEQTLEIEFVAITKDQADEIDKEARTTGADQVQQQIHFLERVCKDWRGVVGDDDQPVFFTNDNFRQALQFGWFRTGVYVAFVNALAGDTARLGN